MTHSTQKICHLGDILPSQSLSTIISCQPKYYYTK